MCGICGVYNARTGTHTPSETLERMLASLEHRGPDDRGLRQDGPLSLGFTRLSIIDLAGGHQPMTNETGDLWLVFNGEIWNYAMLRRDLLAKGHYFHSRGDAETILHAYEEYGLSCFSRLHGMFAFALWDAPRQRLLLARDRVGKKPLYYTRVQGDLVFASEIKALLQDPRVKREVAPQALADFLSIRYVPGPATLFADIFKVQPGHWLLYTKEGLHEEAYWDFTFAPLDSTVKQTEEDYASGVRQHIQRAVEERMMADVPLGAFLSGGVDSSLIVGSLSALSTRRVKTFAVGFDVPGYSELPYARLVAQRFNTEHHELTVSSQDLPRYWPLLTWHRDEPVSEPSDLGVYLVSLLARQHVKVVLSGEGGDELFAGYPKYVYDRFARYYHLLPAPLRRRIIEPWLARLPYSMRRIQLSGRALAESTPQRWVNWFGVFNGPLKTQLFSPSLLTQIDEDSSHVFAQCLRQHPQRDNLSAMLYLDTRFWLPDNLLMKGDKMTMAASLEARMPLLDHHLIEYAATIPSALKVRGLQTKYLLKRAYADMLPSAILSRKKMGFNVPTGAWFRSQQRAFLTNLLLSEQAHDRRFFNHAFVTDMLRNHLAGRTNFEGQLFILASLELWFRVFIDPPQLPVTPADLTKLFPETMDTDQPVSITKHFAPLA